MTGLIIGAIVGVIIIIILIWIIASYNKLIAFKVRVDNGWAQIDVQLKKRFDLIPNLVETVKGYAAHEKSVLENVTQWRAAAMGAKSPKESMEANQQLSKAIANIFVTAEAYPDLKANANFLSLQSELKDIESKIAMSRQFYNDTAMKYNECRTQFPSNMIAGAFGFKERDYYEAASEEKAVPKVQF